MSTDRQVSTIHIESMAGENVGVGSWGTILNVSGEPPSLHSQARLMELEVPAPERFVT